MIINKKTGEKISLSKNFKLYLKLALNYKWLFLLIFLIVIALESFGIFERFLFKFVIDYSSDFVGREITQTKFIFYLKIIAVIFLSLLLVRAIFYFVRVRLNNRLDSNMILDLKKNFFNHLIYLSHNFHTTHKTGSLISRMNRGSRSVESINDVLIFNIIPLVTQLIVFGGALLYFDLTSALVLFITAFTFISYGIFISYKQQIPRYEANLAEDTERGIMADFFTNVDYIKYFGKEEFIKQKYSSLINNSKNKLLKLWRYNAYFRSVNSLILGAGTFLLIYFPLSKLISGDLEIGTLAFIYASYFAFLGSLFSFMDGFRSFLTAVGDFDSLHQYEKIQNEIVDKPNAYKSAIKNGEIIFKTVDFSYHDRKIINNLSLEINPGEKVAFVGHSGSGKTTLIKLLYRFYDTSHGEIFIDGRNIKDFNQKFLRSELSIVPQECILFDDSIYNNILFSNPKASKSDVMRAIKFAQLDYFINQLSKKEDTIVGERGVKLSGGEKQRVSIARALLANKKILVLDEATSSLDSKTENEIQNDLEKLMKDRTSIIIAHRLSTIMKADKIVVLDKSKIVQIGKHRDLINKRGVYKELWNLQKGGYIWE